MVEIRNCIKISKKTEFKHEGQMQSPRKTANAPQFLAFSFVS